jgi:hypothetical protein
MLDLRDAFPAVPVEHPGELVDKVDLTEPEGHLVLQGPPSA